MHRICYLQWRNGYMCIILKGMLQFWSTQIWGNGSLATYIPSPYPLNVKGSNWQVLGLVGALYFALPDPAVYLLSCLSRFIECNYWGCLFHILYICQREQSRMNEAMHWTVSPLVGSISKQCDHNSKTCKHESYYVQQLMTVKLRFLSVLFSLRMRRQGLQTS